MARGTWEKAKNEESEKRKSSGRELKASSGPKVAESLLPHPLQSSVFLSQGCPSMLKCGRPSRGRGSRQPEAG